MPKMPPAPGVLRAVLGYSITGKPFAANILHFTKMTGGAPDLFDLGVALEAWHTTNIIGRQHVNTSLNRIILTDLSTDTGQSIEFTQGLPNTGTLTGDPLPNSIAAVVSLHTAFRGRSFRGRIYHMGLTEGQVAGNHLLTAQADLLRQSYAALVQLSSGGTPTYQLVVLSYWRNKVLRSQGLATPVTVVSCNGRVDSQRRRMPAT